MSLAYPLRVSIIPKAINEKGISCNIIFVQVLNNHTYTYMYSSKVHNSVHDARSKTTEVTSRTSETKSDQSSERILPFPRALVYPRPPRSKFPYEYLRRRRPPCFRMSSAHAPFTKIYMSSHIGKRFLLKARRRKEPQQNKPKAHRRTLTLACIRKRRNRHGRSTSEKKEKEQKSVCGRILPEQSINHPS